MDTVDCKKGIGTKEYNVGKSDYSKHLLQPWDLWKHMSNPWLCDIVKRLLRTKEDTPKMEDYQKIKHILQFLEENYRYDEKTDSNYTGSCYSLDLRWGNMDLLKLLLKDYHFNPRTEKHIMAIFNMILNSGPMNDYFFTEVNRHIDSLIELDKPF